MSNRTTQKNIKQNYGMIIKVGYCNLQSLLRCKSPIAHTERREGWAADIYNLGGGVALVTGYAPFGNIAPSYGLQEFYEKQAREFLTKRLTYRETEAALDSLIENFTRDVIKELYK